MNKTIAVVASSRRHGNTGQLIDHIAAFLDIEVIDLASLDISPYDYQHKNIEDDFLPTIRYILAHDNIIFASPIYWYAMSAQMKIFFDRISSLLSIEELKALGREFRKKTAYVVATSVKQEIDGTFLDVFTKTFDYLGMDYRGHLHAYCPQQFEHSAHNKDIAEFIAHFDG